MTEIRQYNFSTDFYSISYNPADNYLFVDWTGFQTQESVRKGTEKIFDTLKTLGLTKLLNDNTNCKGLWNKNWLISDWCPVAQKAGLKKCAWVLSKEFLCSNEAVLAISRGSLNSLIKTFPDVASAKNWLMN